MNGNNRRPPNLSRMQSGEKAICSQHDDLIKYIYESWSNVESDRSSGGNSVKYYQEQETHNLKDFQPFDLEAYWGRRTVQSIQQTNHS